MLLKIRKLRETAVVPTYGTAAAAGLDLSADLPAAIVLAPGARVGVGTGVALQLPAGYEAQVRPRSGLARDHGVTVLNAPGTIDADYRGEVIVLLVNLGSEPIEIRSGMRIAQMVIAPVAHVHLELVTELSETDRGAGGFGSTGR
ncbi:MAG: dUTP diphosphatase [Kofleriaceae bacterium]|nr:dUTP diphosphatase [Kofleriaceae bacterium]